MFYILREVKEMFCPSCGSEERQVSQFCRACGVDLRAVRVTLEKPDAITASAVSARDEIGHAIADKIRELRNGRDLKKVAEDVLPQIEKFLESPQQRRLRGIREGVVTSAIGLGATVFFFLMSLSQNDVKFLDGAWSDGISDRIGSDRQRLVVHRSQAVCSGDSSK